MPNGATAAPPEKRASSASDSKGPGAKGMPWLVWFAIVGAAAVGLWLLLQKRKRRKSEISPSGR